MKRILTMFALLAFFAFYGDLYSQNQADTAKTPVQHGKNFVDKNGDGYNDNAPDHDGDGIPNGLDPDYTGSKMQHGKRVFVDLNGDGIDDNTGKAKAKRGKGGYGSDMQKGTGNGQNSDGTTGTSNGHGQRRGRK